MQRRRSTAFGLCSAICSVASAAEPSPRQVVSLDGKWHLATDPKNVGRQQTGFRRRPEAKPAKVPWIIQGTFPGYHGVAWYWREFDAPANPHRRGRYLCDSGKWTIWPRSG